MSTPRITVDQIDEIVGRLQRAFDNGADPPRSVLEDLVSDARDALIQCAEVVDKLDDVESNLGAILDEAEAALRQVRS